MLRLTEWMLDETYALGGAKFEVELFGPEHGKLGSHATDGYAIHPKRGHAGVEAHLSFQGGRGPKALAAIDCPVFQCECCVHFVH